MGYVAAFPFIQPESLSLHGEMRLIGFRFRDFGFEEAFRCVQNAPRHAGMHSDRFGSAALLFAMKAAD